MNENYKDGIVLFQRFVFLVYMIDFFNETPDCVESQASFRSIFNFKHIPNLTEFAE